MNVGIYSNIHPSVELGKPISIGKNAYIRSGTILYGYVTIGNNFQTGHNVLIRGNTHIGDYVKIGSLTVIEGNCKIGDIVNIQSQVNITWGTEIEDNVFIGPGTVTLNDKYPPTRNKEDLEAPILKNGCTIGGGVTVLPGVTVGEHCLIGAGSVVVNSIAPNWVAYGNPCRAIKKI